MLVGVVGRRDHARQDTTDVVSLRWSSLMRRCGRRGAACPPPTAGGCRSAAACSSRARGRRSTAASSRAGRSPRRRSLEHVERARCPRHAGDGAALVRRIGVVPRHRRAAQDDRPLFDAVQVRIERRRTGHDLVDRRPRKRLDRFAVVAVACCGRSCRGEGRRCGRCRTERPARRGRSSSRSRRRQAVDGARSTGDRTRRSPRRSRPARPT